jgi:alkanesulfonate monooxygenase SsuD/methylene tetrahydromethanopterin reductase-like flavin-dependent oxidoreductase (luciferase family)
MSGPAKALLVSLALDGGCVDLAGMAALAARIEAAPIDMIVIGSASPGLDPLVVAGWLAPRLSRAGLVAVLPALHTEPFHAARALSALDILSGGRAGWAPTTLGHTEQAARIGPLALTGEGDVGPKALDFMAATRALWDTWDGGALIIDKASGVYLDPGRVGRANYRGAYFQVMGPLNAARPLQGYPVLVQSDDDPLWRLTTDKTDVLLVTAPDVDVLSARRAEIVRSVGGAAILAVIDPADGRSVTKVAEQIADWRAAAIIDGVHLAASDSAELLTFADAILPALKKGGLIAPTRQGESLRSRLGSSPSPVEASRP